VKNSPYLDRPLRSEAQARHEIETKKFERALKGRGAKIIPLRRKPDVPPAH
jgi:hypothetical protein